MLSSLPIDMVYLFIVSYCVWSLAEVGGRQAVVGHNGDIDLVFDLWGVSASLRKLGNQ